MKIFVKTRTNAKRERVEKIDETHFIVAVREMPIEGRANEAVIKALADYFDVARSNIQIVSGHAAKQKRIEIGF